MSAVVRSIETARSFRPKPAAPECDARAEMVAMSRAIRQACEDDDPAFARRFYGTLLSEAKPAAAQPKRAPKSPQEDLTTAKPGDRPALRNARAMLAEAMAEEATCAASGKPPSGKLPFVFMLRLKVWQMEEHGPGFYLDDPKPGQARGK